MYGAILGDIIGSRFEGRRRAIKTKNFELFTERNRFTDDTVLTVAVADALLKIRNSADVNSSDEFKKCLQNWGNKYFHSGYSRSFKHWILAENPQPYGGYTNGSAMRVSPVGWFFDSLSATKIFAKLSAAVSHNDPEGIYGAVSVACAIFLARNGASKVDIKNFIEKNFSYNLSRTLDEIRPVYAPYTACSESVPEAIIAFLESRDFEDAIRNAVSLGGDADTQADIAGSIAEAFYGVPYELKLECRKRLTPEMLEVLDRFYAEISSEKPQENFDNVQFVDFRSGQIIDNPPLDVKTFDDLTPLKDLLETDYENFYGKIKYFIDNVRLFTGDITNLKVDAIVNSVNTRMLGSTLSRMIQQVAGLKLAEACKELKSCNVAEAKITGGFNLPAKNVIHAVGPKYFKKIKDTLLLSVCYMNILDLARENNLHSVALPAISTGARKFPVSLATYIAINSVSDWLNDYPEYDMKVVFVNLEERGTEIYKKQILKYTAENF